MMAISTETEAEAEVSKALKEGGVTVEYQRKKAKEMVKFFKQQQYNQAVEDSQVFGMTPKNEINNGRWTMFGLLVGMMTEYATGVDFIDQVKLTVSVLGIAVAVMFVAVFVLRTAGEPLVTCQRIARDLLFFL